MREMDFTEKDLFNRLCNVNNIWRLIRGEVHRHVKFRLERAMRSFSTVPGAERSIYGIIAYVLNQNRDMPMTEFIQ